MNGLRRAAYFHSWPLGNEPGPGDGVRKKIGAHVRAWTRAGVPTKLFVCARADCDRVWASEIGAENVHIEIARNRRDRLSALRRLASAVRAWDPSFLYLRQEDWLPPLEGLVRSVPSIMELNGDDLAEARAAPIHYRLYRRLTRSRLQDAVVGFVAVSSEFARSRSLVPHGKPVVVIANGINLADFPTLPVTNNAKEAKEAPIRFAFLGAELGAQWHGVPKIIELARRRPEWVFELIGPTRASLGDCPPNVHAHGVLDRAAYEPILARCDVGFGTLAAHTKGLFEASPLKVREYLAYGLPVITGVSDTDFPERVPFLLVLPNEERNVEANVDRIESFARSWKGRRVAREEIMHIDANEKNVRRLAFISSTLSSLPSTGRRGLLDRARRRH